MSLKLIDHGDGVGGSSISEDVRCLAAVRMSFFFSIEGLI